LQPNGRYDYSTTAYEVPCYAPPDYKYLAKKRQKARTRRGKRPLRVRKRKKGKGKKGHSEGKKRGGKKRGGKKGHSALSPMGAIF
jgi:hypothetical protein